MPTGQEWFENDNDDNDNIEQILVYVDNSTSLTGDDYCDLDRDGGERWERYKNTVSYLLQSLLWAKESGILPEQINIWVWNAAEDAEKEPPTLLNDEGEIGKWVKNSLEGDLSGVSGVKALGYILDWVEDQAKQGGRQSRGLLILVTDGLADDGKWTGEQQKRLKRIEELGWSWRAVLWLDECSPDVDVSSRINARGMWSESSLKNHIVQPERYYEALLPSPQDDGGEYAPQLLVPFKEGVYFLTLPKTSGWEAYFKSQTEEKVQIKGVCWHVGESTPPYPWSEQSSERKPGDVCWLSLRPGSTPAALKLDEGNSQIELYRLSSAESSPPTPRRWIEGWNMDTQDLRLWQPALYLSFEKGGERIDEWLPQRCFPDQGHRQWICPLGREEWEASEEAEAEINEEIDKILRQPLPDYWPPEFRNDIKAQLVLLPRLFRIHTFEEYARYEDKGWILKGDSAHYRLEIMPRDLGLDSDLPFPSITPGVSSWKPRRSSAEGCENLSSEEPVWLYFEFSPNYGGTVKKACQANSQCDWVDLGNGAVKLSWARLRGKYAEGDAFNVLKRDWKRVEKIWLQILFTAEHSGYSGDSYPESGMVFQDTGSFVAFWYSCEKKGSELEHATLECHLMEKEEVGKKRLWATCASPTPTPSP